jgi:hypothetical protein
MATDPLKPDTTTSPLIAIPRKNQETQNVNQSPDSVTTNIHHLPDSEE